LTSAAEIGVDQAAIGLVDGRDKRCVANPFPGRELRKPAVFVDAGSWLGSHGLALMYHA